MVALSSCWSVFSDLGSRILGEPFLVPFSGYGRSNDRSAMRDVRKSKIFLQNE